MGKSKRKHRGRHYKENNTITYNTAKPNRQARRLGIKAVEPPKEEEPKRVSRATILSEKVQQAKEREKRIVPKGMTYGEYMEYLSKKRQQLEAKVLQK